MRIFVLTATYELRVSRKNHLRDHPTCKTSYEWCTRELSQVDHNVWRRSFFSDFLDLDVSVILGSTLGPLLFLGYINNFRTCTSMLSALFADDTSGRAKGYVLQDVISYVNLELQKVANWFLANKMSLNDSKTKYIIFRTYNKPVDPQIRNVIYNCT
jgi:hypothetical protein